MFTKLPGVVERTVNPAPYLLLVAFLAALIIVGTLRNWASRSLSNVVGQRGGIAIMVWGLAIAGLALVTRARGGFWLWLLSAVGVIGGVSLSVAERSGWLANHLRERALSRIKVKPPLPEVPNPRRSGFGPNEPQVSTFLQIVANLPADAWQVIVSRSDQVTSSPFKSLALAAARRALDSAGRDIERMEATGALDDIVKRGSIAGEDAPSPGSLNGQQARYAASYEAVEALVVRDLIAAKHFAVLYQAFEHAVPITSLGFGRSAEPMRLETPGSGSEP
jgi:hypothetical protein